MTELEQAVDYIEELTEKVSHLERDLEDLRRPVIERSIEELDQEQRDTLEDVADWLREGRKVHTFPNNRVVQLLYDLYTRRADEVSALRVELTKQTHLAQAEHKRADEAVLDLRNEIGKNRADVRYCIVRYLQHLATPEEAEKLCSIDSAALSTVARWIRASYDLVYENERQATVDEPTLMLGDSWEEKCIIQGHAPLCEKMYYKDSNLCSCGREAWEQMRIRAREEAVANEAAFADTDPIT